MLLSVEVLDYGVLAMARFVRSAGVLDSSLILQRTVVYGCVSH